MPIDELASRIFDPLLAASLRRHACEWRDMAAEVRIVQRDPMYQLIHDRPLPGPTDGDLLA